MKDLEKIYKVLGNRRRLSIIKILKQKKKVSVGDIAQGIRLSVRSTSRHLALMRGVDIVDREQVGLTVFYSLDVTNPILKHLLTIV